MEELRYIRADPLHLAEVVSSALHSPNKHVILTGVGEATLVLMIEKIIQNND